MLFFHRLRQLMRSRILSLSLCLLLLNLPGVAQKLTSTDTTVYTVVEYQPVFLVEGGLKGYLQKNVQYPAEARKAGVKGRVFVSFIVERDGSLTDVRVLRGLDYGCDEEAVRVIKDMPRWKPGGQSGILGRVDLRVRYNVAVLFGIDYTYYPRMTKY